MHCWWVMLTFTYVWYFYLLLEFWEWYDVVCFRLGRPPVRPKFLTRNTLLCQLPFHISEIKCYVLRSVKYEFTWSWVPQVFMVNLWCPYFKMYPVWIIYLWCYASTCVICGPTCEMVFILVFTWSVVQVIVVVIYVGTAMFCSHCWCSVV